MEALELQQIVSALLGALGVSVQEITVSTGHRTLVRVTSEDSKRIIGPHGEHLRALNSVARRLVETKHGLEAANFHIDINDYHESQMEGLRANAQLLAQRARLFHHEVEMSPMTAYERLVVHEMFADDQQIKTESRGEGKFRHIVILLKSN